MKTKKLNNKLSLNKTTITNLDEIRMDDVRGGSKRTFGWTCETCDPQWCPTYLGTICPTCEDC